ncbi:MAG: transporter [Archangium gephyra]|uniref:Transporter n=1 Tax=Archangium gephyra TaxID=48 RepID=A0A2W5TFT4_9BACT|nr:MAG: transporter [Archangium gephyra]
MNDEARDENGHLIRELHGVTLANILEYLVDRLGWDELAAQIRINCFAVNPSVKSSLTFLRRTPWARKKVEALYVEVRSDEVSSRG